MIRVFGVITDPAGEPVPGAIIELRALSSTREVLASSVLIRKCDRLGRYDFNLAVGVYDAYAQNDRCGDLDYLGTAIVRSNTSDGDLNHILDEISVDLTPPVLVAALEAMYRAESAANKTDQDKQQTAKDRQVSGELAGEAQGAAADAKRSMHEVKAIAEMVESLPLGNGYVSESITPAGDTAILDLAKATVFRVTLNTHITQIVFTNASGEEGSSRYATLILRQGTGVNLVSWPENVRWSYGHPPVLSYEKDGEDCITLVNFGTDAHWYGFLTGGWIHV